MNKSSNDVPVVVPTWPSIDHVAPDEEGGPTARNGFNYQDEIAVSFLIEMLENEDLLKVHCETHDDIVLVRQCKISPKLNAEYVQVKAIEQDKLWSVADVCNQKKGKGSSIFEKSLFRDKHDEVSTFRLVTLRPVVKALETLTYELTAACRSPESEGFMSLHTELEKRFPDITSPKGNGAFFWLKNCFWDQRDSEEAVKTSNLVLLLRLSAKESRPLLLEAAEVLLCELRGMAKAAGDAKWIPDRDKKIILRENLRAWWDQRTYELTEGASLVSGGKLITKMREANLPNDLIELAVEMRRNYASETRAPRYLEPLEADCLRQRVLSEVASLRAHFISDQVPTSGAEFHTRCLDRMEAVNAERGETIDDRSAFLKGCMYDIVDRCLLRFKRWTP